MSILSASEASARYAGRDSTEPIPGRMHNGRYPCIMLNAWLTLACKDRVNIPIVLLSSIKQPFSPRVTITNLIFGNLKSMETKATGVDEAPVQAYKITLGGKNRTHKIATN